MAGADQRPPESLWLRYDADTGEVYEDECNAYSLDLSYLPLDPSTIKLNGVASLVDRQGLTKLDKRRLQQRVKQPDGSSCQAPIEVTGKPEPGVVQRLVWLRGSGPGRGEGSGRSWQGAGAAQTRQVGNFWQIAG